MKKHFPKADASVVIPVWNEKKNIGSVLNGIPRGYEIIVVDDGSTDNTSDVVKAFGFSPIILSKHSGKGAACLRGAAHAKGKYVIFMDGDGQHDPRDLKNFSKMLGKSDLVLGCRDYSKLPLHRRFTNMAANYAVRIMTGKNFSDVQCGFRGITKSALKKLKLGSRGYEFEIDMAREAAFEKLRIAEIPVRVYYNGKHNGKNFTVGSRMSKTSSFDMFVYLIKNVGKYSILSKMQRKRRGK